MHRTKQNGIKQGWSGGGLSLGLVLLSGTVAVAQAANFGSLTLDANTTSGTLSGLTGGSTSLPAIVSNSDQQNNKCLGFGDPKPDHILTLKQAVPRLQLRVSSGNDTTLVVAGPNGVIRCSDDISARNKDAGITDTNWQPGDYRIWVGSVTPGDRYHYTLSIRP